MSDAGLIKVEDLKKIASVADYGADGLTVTFNGGRQVHVPHDVNNPDFHVAQDWLSAQRKAG